MKARIKGMEEEKDRLAEKVERAKAQVRVCVNVCVCWSQNSCQVELDRGGEPCMLASLQLWHRVGGCSRRDWKCKIFGASMSGCGLI